MKTTQSIQIGHHFADVSRELSSYRRLDDAANCVALCVPIVAPAREQLVVVPAQGNLFIAGIDKDGCIVTESGSVVAVNAGESIPSDIPTNFSACPR